VIVVGVREGNAVFGEETVVVVVVVDTGLVVVGVVCAAFPQPVEITITISTKAPITAVRRLFMSPTPIKA
jgi:hypothetical protein